MKKIFLSLGGLLLGTVLTYGQANISPAKAQSTPIIITGATIHVGNGQVINNGTIKISNGKIEQVAANITVPADASIDAEVDIGPIAAGFGIAARLTVSLPGMDRAAAVDLVNTAHQVCPYSNATRGNIDVTITVA